MNDLKDRIEIADLLYRGALVADERSIDDYGSVYASDATISIPGMPQQRGIHDIRAGTRAFRDSGSSGPGSFVRHLVTPVEIIAQGDEAFAISYVLALASTDASPAPQLFGTYRDRLARRVEGWRIVERSFTFDA